SPTVFTSFSGTVMKHAYVTSMKCMSCHEYNMQWKTNSGLRTRRSPNHHAGQDVGGSGCHNTRDKHVARAPTARQTSPTTTTTARTVGPVTRAPAGTAAASTSASAAASSPDGRFARSAGAEPVAAPAFTHSSAAGTACVTCHTAASRAGTAGCPLPHGGERQRQACRPYCEQQCLSELSYDTRLAPRDSRGPHPGGRRVRDLSQRDLCDGQALASSPDARALRKLPHHQCLDTGTLRPRRRHGA